VTAAAPGRDVVQTNKALENTTRTSIMHVPHLSASRFNKYEPLHHTLREVVRYDILSRLTANAFAYKCILRGYGFHVPAVTD
jgi:hypothetical protein